MAATELLSRKVSYKGNAISVKSLESTISAERNRQNVDIEQLKTLKSKNDELSKALSDEIKELRKFSDYFSAHKLKGSFLSNLKEILSYIPGLGSLMITRRSIEELLKQQYEISSMRVKEVADFSDRLKAAEQGLFEEVDRLNAKIIESAENQEMAADIVLELRDVVSQKEQALEEMDKSSIQFREADAELDSLRHLLSEHSTKLELYSSAEDRLAKLKDNTRRLQKTITNLYSDIKKYVIIASEKLDDSLAQIQAIGTAADASLVLLDMKTSLDTMTASMNQTTQFVSETQMYLRENLDSLINELEIYDADTQKMLQTNLDRSEQIESDYIQKAVDKALKYKEEKAAGAV